MLDISNVPNVDTDVRIKKHTIINGVCIYVLSDEQTYSRVYFNKKNIKKYLKVFEDVIKNQDKYRHVFHNARGYEWFRIIYIDDSLTGSSDYLRLDRVPIYIEMFKHIGKCKVYLDKEHLLSQNLYVLEEVNKKIKTRKRLYKVDNKPYIKV